MNIQQAMAEIRRAVRLYNETDDFGRPVLPVTAQRPIYLEGPPGVGKTAILKQIADEADLGLVSYTMTHHTRQTALGLPRIEQRVLMGETYEVTEYTLSEIVAEVLKAAEVREKGILFLDEINCVAESLRPAMLALLQEKRFGNHSLPKGWIIVTAGNPEMYNRGARSFDAVTLDRVRKLVIEPDIAAFFRFAEDHPLHPAVSAYLKLRPEDFFVTDGDAVITARSWTDLSDMMLSMDRSGYTMEDVMFGEYLQIASVAERFNLFYRLTQRTDEDGNAALETAPAETQLYAAQLAQSHFAHHQRIAKQLARQTEKLRLFRDNIPESDRAARLKDRENALGTRIRLDIISHEEAGQEQQILRLLRRAVLGGESIDNIIADLESKAQDAKAEASDAENHFQAVLDHITDPAVKLIFRRES
ncbi:MAG: AAA family ATPase [Clostridia bacterium]|nr:AAA family ATPase [Clostridia bacterium]